MRRIVLIGASGVGKTTLYKKLYQIPKSQRSYIVLKEAFKTAALNCEVSVRQFNIFLCQQVLKYNLIRRKELGLGKVILQAWANGNGDERDKYDTVSASFDILYHFLKDEPNPYYVKKRMTRFLRKVDDYLLLEDFLPADTLVMVDEGMTTHHYPGITKYGWQEYTREQLISDPVFNPEGLIHCVRSAEEIFKQALKRRENGIYTFSHGPLNKKELRKHIDKNILKDIKKIESFKKLGIPVLEVNTGEDFTTLRETIDGFAASLINPAVNRLPA